MGGMGGGGGGKDGREGGHIDFYAAALYFVIYA